MPRMPYAKAHTVIVGTDMRMDRPQAIMPRMPAAGLAFHLAGGEVDFVVQNDHIRRFKLVKPHGGLHRLTRVVHECLGLEQDHAVRAKTPFDR